jgi:hypothetical protein
MANLYLIVSRDFFGDDRPGYFTGTGWTKDKQSAWPFSMRVVASECNAENRVKDPHWPKTEIVKG